MNENSIKKNQQSPLRLIRSRNFLLPLGLILIGVLLFVFFMLTKPQANRISRPKEALLIEIDILKSTDEKILIHGMGTVRPSIQIPLQARVTGEILEVNPKFIPGGLFKKGEALLKIDPSDFELTLEQAKSDYVQAKANVQLELANQSIAKSEYQLLAETIEVEDLALVLREPQLTIAKAQLQSAESRMKRAQLDLDRTVIKAPFNGAIIERSVELGAQLSAGNNFGTFAGTDQYWVETNIPVEHLKWLIFNSKNKKGSKVLLRQSLATDERNAIQGNVSHTAMNIEEGGRLLTVYITIELPIEQDNKNTTQLFLNSFVRLEITGKEITGSFKIPREYIRNGNNVWIMNDKNELQIKTLGIAYRGKEHIYAISGLKDGERIITSNITTPVPGMSLRAQDK